MAFINGYINLGTALAGLAVVTPPDGVGYRPQAISFDSVDPVNGTTFNSVTCVFGPVQDSWGRLTCFGITDLDGDPMWSGKLTVAITPLPGQLVFVPLGSIELISGNVPSFSPALDFSNNRNANLRLLGWN